MPGAERVKLILNVGCLKIDVSLNYFVIEVSGYVLFVTRQWPYRENIKFGDITRVNVHRNVHNIQESSAMMNWKQ